MAGVIQGMSPKEVMRRRRDDSEENFNCGDCLFFWGSASDPTTISHSLLNQKKEKPLFDGQRGEPAPLCRVCYQLGFCSCTARRLLLLLIFSPLYDFCGASLFLPLPWCCCALKQTVFASLVVAYSSSYGRPFLVQAQPTVLCLCSFLARPIDRRCPQFICSTISVPTRFNTIQGPIWTGWSSSSSSSSNRTKDDDRQQLIYNTHIPGQRDGNFWTSIGRSSRRR